MKHARRRAAPVRWPVVLATSAVGAVLLALTLVLLQAEREADAPAPAVLATPRATPGEAGLVTHGRDASAEDSTQALTALPLLNADGTPVDEGAKATLAVAADGTVEATFSGRVVDAAGQPIAGALVRHVAVTALRKPLDLVADKRTGDLRWDKLASTTTDAEGRFTLATRELPRTLPDAVDAAAGEAGADAGSGDPDGAGSLQSDTAMLRSSAVRFLGGHAGISGMGYLGEVYADDEESDADDDSLPEAPVLVVSHPGHALQALTCKDFRRGACAVGDICLLPGSVLVGRVTDADGRVVPGAQIGPPHGGWLTHSPQHWELLRQLLHAESGADGRFRLENLWEAQYAITIGHPDFVPELRYPELPEAGVADLEDVQLQPGRTITGRVLDVDGTPRAGAEILARAAFQSPDNPGLDTLLHEAASSLSSYNGAHEVHAISADDGSFVLSTLNLDAYAVFADAPDRDPACARGVRAGTQGLQLQLSSAASLLITVVDGATGLPLAGVEASAHRRSRGGQQGRTQLDPQLDVLRGAEALAEVRARLEAAGGIAPTAPAAPAAPAAPVAPVAPVAPAAPAGTAGTASSPAAPTDDVGTGLLLVQRAGALRTDVSVSAPGHATRAFVLPGVAPGEQLQRTLKLWKESVIAGRVLDASGQPIAGVQLRCEPPETQRAPSEAREASTDADGNYRIGALFNGEWQLSASGEGWLPADARPVFVRREQLREGVDLVLQAGAVLTGLVLDAKGVPSVGDYVSVTQGVGEAQTEEDTETDAQGRFRFDALLPGAAEVQCWPALPVSLSLSSAQPIDIVLQLRAQPVISGRVMAGGQPVPKATVWARSSTRGNAVVEASETGAYELQVWSAGEWAVFALPARPVRSAATEPLPVQVDWDRRTQLDLEFTGVSVSGRVVDAVSGQPVQGANATLSDRVVPKVDGVQAPLPLLRRPSATATTDAEGRFRIDWVRPGECSITARGPRSRMQEPLALTVGTEPVEGVELALPQGQSLSGTLRTGSGGPLPPQLQLRLDQEGSNMSWYVSLDEDDGSWEYSGELPAGAYRVRVVQQVGNWFGEDSERELTSVGVSLAPGELRFLNIVLDG